MEAGLRCTICISLIQEDGSGTDRQDDSGTGTRTFLDSNRHLWTCTRNPTMTPHSVDDISDTWDYGMTLEFCSTENDRDVSLRGKAVRGSDPVGQELWNV